jgi:hypothetical protein
MKMTVVERLQKLQREAGNTFGYPLMELVEITLQLAHKVQELEPEQITEEDIELSRVESFQQRTKQYLEEQSLKLANELAIEIGYNAQLVPTKVLSLAQQLKVKLDAASRS